MRCDSRSPRMCSASTAWCGSTTASPSTEPFRQIAPRSLTGRGAAWSPAMSVSHVLPAIRPPAPKHDAERVPSDRLRVSKVDLDSAIAAAGPTADLPTIVLEHALTSLTLAFAGIRYLCQGAAVREAYRRMTTAEFTRINARQAWANWRVIPRNLHGNLRIDRPV